MKKPIHKIFKFLDWSLDIHTYQLKLNYFIESLGKVTETLTLPKFNIVDDTAGAIEKSCELIHLMCGVSYYKAGLAEQIIYVNYQPNANMDGFVKNTWFHGLAELAYENNVDLKFKRDSRLLIKKVRTPFNSLKPLVALGGGKDSLVTIEELKKQSKNMHLFMVGDSKLIKEVAEFVAIPLIQVHRKIDNKLIEYNATGAGFNGHVPVTAINSSIAILCALLYDCDAIVFSNERSADSGNTVNANGGLVNHQYSKSHAFEKELSEIIHCEISQNLSYYSQQRAYSELAILKKFSNYSQYFPIFSSCNRNFHIDGSRNVTSRWCCDCPKCRFVFLGLAPFIGKHQLLDIFKRNLLDDATQKHGFAELLGIKGFKPFECVGEIEESQLAFNLIQNNPQWQGDYLLEYFKNKVPHISTEQQKRILQPTA